MYVQATKYDLNLAQMADEPLVILAQECAFQPAADELVLRYCELMSNLIAGRAKRHRFVVDVQDAQQNGVFAILEAIARYNTQEVAKANGCSFRSYVYMVVLARFQDFVKHVRRVEKRYCSLEASADSPANRSAPGSTSRQSDPVELLVQQEAMGCLQALLDRLDDSMRGLWQALIQGKKLPCIAREQGVSYDRVKRQRRRLLAHLTIQLRKQTEPRP